MVRSRYAFPIRDRIKLAIRIWFSKTVDFVRTPVRQPEILLVAGGSTPEKLSAVNARLQFLTSHFPERVVVRTVSRASPTDFLRSSGVAAADASALPAFASRRLPWVADLDHETNPIDAWALVSMGAAITHRPSRKSIADSRQLFADRVSQLKADGSKPVYLFGTGPSLNQAGDRSFSDGITIVCNTFVRDPVLWHHLNPAFLAAADALYHFGPSAHARAFRADALQRLRESDGRTLFVYPAPFDLIVRSEFEEVESVLVPIPRSYTNLHSDIAVDLTKHFSLPPLGNVLGDMLLPLGCTLSKDVRLWGFDGRKSTDTGFWSYSSPHSYVEHIEALREAHPAFYNNAVPAGNEFKYIKQVHGDQLEDRLVDAERRGFTFRLLTPSSTETLQKRYWDVASRKSSIPGIE